MVTKQVKSVKETYPFKSKITSKYDLMFVEPILLLSKLEVISNLEIVENFLNTTSPFVEILCLEREIEVLK